MRSVLIVMALACMPSCQASRSTKVVPLIRAHAHNDYEHRRPLLDALDNGLCSIEADIVLVDDRLLVAHDRDKVSPSRTLQSLYLDPLQSRVRANGGRVYRDYPGPVTLMIDFKSHDPAMYAKLRHVLDHYADMITTWRDGKVEQRAVTILLTGDRPSPQRVASEAVRMVAIDGHLNSPDADSDISPAVMPEISGNWKDYFHWDGRGEMPADERTRLREIANRVHARGRRLRMWGAPDNPATWSELLAAGVDVINTDDLPGVREFFLEHR